MTKLKISTQFRGCEAVHSIAQGRENGLFCFLNVHVVATDTVSREISLNLLCHFQGEVN